MPRGSTEGDFLAINELACSKGVLAILEEACLWDRDWSDRFAEMKSAYERALWTFLNEPRRFQAAGNFHELDRLGGWKRRVVGKLLDVGTDSEQLNDLEARLRAFFARQGRGRFCHVDYYERTNPERHCFFAYPEDFPNTDLGYDDAGELQHRTRRSAFEIIFVYRPGEGVLEVHASGGKNTIEPLMEILCTTVLGLKSLPADGQMPFDLTSLKDRNFNFAVEAKDQIEAFDILELKRDIAGNGSGQKRSRVTLCVPLREINWPARRPRLHVLTDLFNIKDGEQGS